MSYKSIKRFLGETSLERKCLFLFAGFLFVLIIASFAYYGFRTVRVVYEQNSVAGEGLVDQALISKHWKKLAGSEESEIGFPWDGECPRCGYKQELLPEKEHLGEQDLIKKLTEELSKKDYTCDFIVPRRQEGMSGARTDFDFYVLDYYSQVRKDDKKYAKFIEQISPDGKEYVYYEPIYAEKTCSSCHTPPPGGIGTGFDPTMDPGSSFTRSTAKNEGDFMAVAKVTISNVRMQEKLSKNWAILWGTAAFSFFVTLLASYLIIRYVIVKPLRHLRDVSNEVSQGNTDIRADIHTGDEFEMLAVAFNRMLHNLVHVQDDLRKANVDLDSKVDELAQANMQLFELNQIKSDFLATMSHELRTPLNSIIGFSEVLGGISSLDDKQRRYVGNIQSSGRMLLDMINDILDVAKIESGKVEIRPTEFHLRHVVETQCDIARPLTEKKGIELKSNVESNLPAMYQDQSRIQQILGNLLSNAVKFTPESGRITVSARRDTQGRLVLEVSDTGVGIAEEDQNIIFEQFRQGVSATPQGDSMAREYTGTGLGLSIVMELCRLLGGDVSVRSQVGKGSTFTVNLPWRLIDMPRRDDSMTENLDKLTRPSLPLDRPKQ